MFLKNVVSVAQCNIRKSGRKSSYKLFDCKPRRYFTKTKDIPGCWEVWVS